MSKIHSLAVFVGENISNCIEKDVNFKSKVLSFVEVLKDKHNAHILHSKIYKIFSDKDILKNVIIYTFKKVFYNIIWLLSVLALSLLLNLGIIPFIILGSFTLLRSKIGGFHFNDDNICLLTSTVIPILISYIVVYFDFNLVWLVIGYIVVSLIIIKKGVIENHNKKYDDNNQVLNLKLKEKFRKHSYYALLLIAVINIIMYVNGKQIVSDCLLLGSLSATVNLLFVHK